jgi:hypothetical protein
MCDNTHDSKGATHPPGAAPPISPCPPGKALSYTHGRWRSAPSPLTGAGDFLEDVSEAGYSLLHLHGIEHSALWLEVFEHRENDNFLVVINTASKFYTVLVPDVPSLFQLLGELLPVVEASLRLEAAAEEHERKMKVRRRGGVYNAAKRCMEVPS